MENDNVINLLFEFFLKSCAYNYNVLKTVKDLKKTDFRGKKKKAGVGVDISNLFGSEVYKKKNFINIIIAT